MKLPNEINHLFQKGIKANDIINSMNLDKKTINSIIKLILVKGIGKAFIYNKVNKNHLNIFLKKNGFK